MGVASSHPPDCPWDPRLLLDEQQGKKKKDTKKIRDSGNELKKKQERCEYLMRAVPLSMEATVGVNVTEDEKGELGGGENEQWRLNLGSGCVNTCSLRGGFVQIGPGCQRFLQHTFMKHSIAG